MGSGSLAAIRSVTIPRREVRLSRNRDVPGGRERRQSGSQLLLRTFTPSDFLEGAGAGRQIRRQLLHRDRLMVRSPL
jgi:hypothetical protein